MLLSRFEVWNSVSIMLYRFKFSTTFTALFSGLVFICGSLHKNQLGCKVFWKKENFDNDNLYTPHNDINRNSIIQLILAFTLFESSQLLITSSIIMFFLFVFPKNIPGYIPYLFFRNVPYSIAWKPSLYSNYISTTYIQVL